MKFTPLRLALISALLLPGLSLADDSKKVSENFDKTDKFLPGEEVVSPRGQKLKIWSTEGPVPVDRAPEPFEDPADRLDDQPIILDVDQPRKRLQQAPIKAK